MVPRLTRGWALWRADASAHPTVGLAGAEVARVDGSEHKRGGRCSGVREIGATMRK